MVKTILFDLDGTLADIRHRRKFLDVNKPDWKSFNSEMGNDTPNKPIVELYNVLWNSSHFEIILITGRMESTRKQTEQWLTWNEIPFSMLKMRTENDFRADHFVKEEMLVEFKKQNKEILFVVDDRQQVVDMWRRHGITCLQCDEGNF